MIPLRKEKQLVFHVNNAIINELISGITASLSDNVVQIILYGSQARGEQQEDSDIDLAVILKRPMTNIEEDKLSDFIVDMNLKYDRVFSVVDINEDRFLKWKGTLPFYQNVSKEGVSLWTAA